jgi:hypothetical protein
VDVDISGEIENLRVNGVDVVPLVEAELSRRYPGSRQDTAAAPPSGGPLLMPRVVADPRGATLLGAEVQSRESSPTLKRSR